MFRKDRFAVSQYVIGAFVVFAVAFSGCNGLKPIPPTLAPAALPTVTLVIDPPSKKVLAGQEVTLVVQASGSNLRYEWSVIRGTISGIEAQSVIYTAPNTAGKDVVMVKVTSDSGTTTESVNFEIIVPPTPTLEPTPTPVPTIMISNPLEKVVCPLDAECAFDVAGVSSGVASSSNLKVVVFVNPDPGQPGMWWPHHKVSINNDGAWKGKAQIGSGSCWPANDDFQIVALVITADRASTLANDFQPLPQEYVAKSNIVDLVTAYDPIQVDLSRASSSSDKGSTINLSAEETFLAFDYDLGTGGWVLITVGLNRDLSCLKEQGAFVSFSFEGTGNANSVEAKLEDIDGTNYGWLSMPGESVGTKTIKLSLNQDFEYWWGGNPPKMDWQQVRNIQFAISRKEKDEGGKGRVTIRDVSITP